MSVGALERARFTAASRRLLDLRVDRTVKMTRSSSFFASLIAEMIVESSGRREVGRISFKKSPGLPSSKSNTSLSRSQARHQWSSSHNMWNPMHTIGAIPSGPGSCTTQTNDEKRGRRGSSPFCRVRRSRSDLVKLFLYSRVGGAS